MMSNENLAFQTPAHYDPLNILMKPPLQPPDSHHLSAAQGWLGLGNQDEANQELEKITPGNQAHPSVLATRLEICATAGKWDAAADTAAQLVEQERNEPMAWITLAYATRRKPGGGMVQAKEVLIPAQKLFPKVWLIPYNLACYECQLGNQKEARAWLKKAFKLGDSKELKRMALKDPDLEPFWREIGEM
jgi:Flp pilus assembly protein TadD